MAEAMLASTCNGIMMDIIFLSLEFRKGLINIHPEANRTIIKKLMVCPTDLTTAFFTND
jgi:hypothetical protein